MFECDVPAIPECCLPAGPWNSYGLSSNHHLLMEDIEQRVLSTFKSRLRFWKRYVDDTCTAIQPCIIEEFHQHLNSIEPSIQFTYEIEQNNQLPFLKRQDDGSILTSVFKKSTRTDQYLHFNLTPFSVTQAICCPYTVF